MRHEQIVSVGTVSERRCLIEVKIWLEGARDMLIPAIQKAENELQRIRQLESEFAKAEAPLSVTERLVKIRSGIEGCLTILRDQDREWIQRIQSVEASGQISDGRCIIEFQGWLEGAHEMLITAIQRAENELLHVRQTESAFSRTEALFPLAEELIKIRAGMEECLEILRDQSIDWISRLTWIENLKNIAAVWPVSSDDTVEIPAEASSKSLIAEFGVSPFHYGEQAGIDEGEFETAVPQKASSKRSLAFFTFLAFATALITASLGYLTVNQSNRISELHQYVHTLKNDLSTSHTANKDLSIKNAELTRHIVAIEDRTNDLKDKVSELALALQTEHSRLIQSKHDLDDMKSTDLKMISEIKSQLANTQTELNGALYLSEISKAKLGRSLVLSPVWFTSGESAKILDGKFTMEVEQATGRNSCSEVSVQLSSAQPGSARNPFNKSLCPRLMIPEDFNVKYNRYSVVLLGNKTNDDGSKAYLIAVLKK